MTERIKQLVEQLNRAAKAYYQEDREILSNQEYDALYDELAALEQKTGTILANSPTQKVGYTVLSNLVKVAHESPILSLDKTKETAKLVSFLGDKAGILSWKLDGLTIVLKYNHGKLEQAVTRGNGEIGEDVTHNARVFRNVPLSIPFQGELVLRGEGVIPYSEFYRINEELGEEEQYKNPRNLCSGTVRQLNSEIAAKRNVKFIAFTLVSAEGITLSDSKAENMAWLAEMGFDVVEHCMVTAETVAAAVEEFRDKIEQNDIASDGLVLTFDSIAYSQSLGRTAKFPKDSIAFKWADEMAETTLRQIEWNTSRTGLMNPVAVFDPVELEGSTVSRASLHNVSILKELKLSIGDTIKVYKANMIIPQIAENLTGTVSTAEIPKHCFVCGEETEIRKLRDGEALYCTNPNCSAQRIQALSHFVSRDAMNIEGLSEETLKKFLEKGFVENYPDLFRLEKHQAEITAMEGFGEKSYQNLIASVEKAKTAELPNFIYALGINHVGLRNAKLLCREFDYDLEKIKAATEEELVQVEGFGEIIAHSIAYYFRQEAHLALLADVLQHLDYENQFSIYDSDDQEKIMREAFKRLNMSTTDKSFSVKGAMSIISHLKEEMTSWEDYAQHVDKNDLKAVRIAKVYQTYQKMLKENNALDFDDLIYKTVLLFRQFPDVLEKYQERFRYIMVDEYQDTNTSQYELVAMLAAKYKNLCVVGDDDQSIYGWRGANIRNILDFEKDFPDTTVIKLEQNYRSTKKILEAANAVIHHNQTRKDKTLWTENDSGSILHIYKADNEYDECRFVAEKILELEKQGKTRNQMAVLYRTNAQSRAVEDQMVKRGIPYRLFGGVRFYERKEIRDILSYLKVLANPADTIALRRIINVPKRGIGETSLDKLAAFAEENGLSLYGALSRLDEITTLKTRVAKFKDFYGLFEQLREDADGLSVSELIDAIVKRTGYLQLLMAEGTDDALNRIQNIDEFVNKAAEYDKANPEGKLEGFLEEVALVADIDSYEEGEETVALMTLHSAKGLEFPYVFIIGMEEGIFPGFRAVMYGGEKEIEEERRLCYVGITRAKEELYLTHAKSRMQHGITQYNPPSRFLKEIPADLVDMPTRQISDMAKKYDAMTQNKPALGRKNVLPPTAKFGGVGMKKEMPAPKDFKLSYGVGDKVRAPKYGIGTVVSINNGGADFEVTVSFGAKGTKKFMARLSKLIKVSE